MTSAKCPVCGRPTTTAPSPVCGSVVKLDPEACAHEPQVVGYSFEGGTRVWWCGVCGSVGESGIDAGGDRSISWSHPGPRTRLLHEPRVTVGAAGSPTIVDVVERAPDPCPVCGGAASLPLFEFDASCIGCRKRQPREG